MDIIDKKTEMILGRKLPEYMEWYDNDVKGGNGLSPDAEQEILDDIFASWDDDPRPGDSSKPETKKCSSHLHHVVPSDGRGSKYTDHRSSASQSSQVQHLENKYKKEPASLTDQFLSELYAFDDVLGVAENSDKQNNNTVVELSRQRSEQSSTATSNKKRNHDSAQDQDVMKIVSPRKRCRHEEPSEGSEDSLRGHHPVMSHDGKRLSDLTPEDNVIGVDPPRKSPSPPMIAGSSTNVVARPQASITASKQRGVILPQEPRYSLATSHRVMEERSIMAEKVRKRPLDILVEDATDSNPVLNSKRQRIAAISPLRESTTTAPHGIRVPDACSRSHKVSSNSEQHAEESNIKQVDPAQQRTSLALVENGKVGEGRGGSTEAHHNGDQANRKPKVRSAPSATPADPTSSSSTTNFRIRRPETIEEQRQVAEAIKYTYIDLKNRRQEFRNMKNLNIEKDKETGREYDTCQESYGYQWNRLQLMFQEAVENEAGVVLDTKKSRRKSKKRKEVEANREYLVEVDGPWLTGFDDWKPPGSSKQREIERQKARDELKKLGTCAEPVQL
ncbi:MAG: hypothetical protein Q9191_004045 [Dirinaria sp. TL-2023a]